MRGFVTGLLLCWYVLTGIGIAKIRDHCGNSVGLVAGIAWLPSLVVTSLVLGPPAAVGLFDPNELKPCPP